MTWILVKPLSYSGSPYSLSEKSTLKIQNVCFTYTSILKSILDQSLFICPQPGWWNVCSCYQISSAFKFVATNFFDRQTFKFFKLFWLKKCRSKEYRTSAPSAHCARNLSITDTCIHRQNHTRAFEIRWGRPINCQTPNLYVDILV